MIISETHIIKNKRDPRLKMKETYVNEREFHEPSPDERDPCEYIEKDTHIEKNTHQTTWTPPKGKESSARMARTHTCTHTYAHTHIHTNTHTHICTHTYPARIHTHQNTWTPPKGRESSARMARTVQSSQSRKDACIIDTCVVVCVAVSGAVSVAVRVAVAECVAVRVAVCVAVCGALCVLQCVLQ